MIDNKLFLDECFKNFFDVLVENFCYVLKTSNYKEINDPTAILKVQKISFNSVAKEFVKYQQKELQVKSKTSKEINDINKIEITKKLDQLVNETTDELDKVVRKTYNNNNSESDKQNIKQAAFNIIITDVRDYFERNKFLKNTELNRKFSEPVAEEKTIDKKEKKVC